jgi:F5/8 type C domain
MINSIQSQKIKYKRIALLFVAIVLCLSAYSQKHNGYINLALNPNDTRDFNGIYPHASSNSETREEKAFLAINAINGITDNNGHGNEFPSWGPHKEHKGTYWQVDFGKSVLTNELVIYLRADFPHDGWWEKANIEFSDSTSIEIRLKKTAEPQSFDLGNKKTELIRITDLKQAVPNTWCAITEIEVWGNEITKTQK